MASKTWDREMGALQATVKAIHDDVTEVKYHIKQLNGSVNEQQIEVAKQCALFEVHEKNHEKNSVKFGGVGGVFGGSLVASLMKLMGL